MHSTVVRLGPRLVRRWWPGAVWRQAGREGRRPAGEAGLAGGPPGSYREQRLAALGPGTLYPHKFAATIEVPAFTEKYQHLGGSEEGAEEERLCGMVAGVREASRSLRFLDLAGQGGVVQLKVDGGTEGRGAATALLRRGDRVGAAGRAIRSRSGQLCLAAGAVTLLAPCLRTIPATGFETSNKRLHRKYLDFIVNEDARKVIIDRSRITQYVRSFLLGRGFLEVETPVLSPSGGGAAARPFTCRHHHLDMQLFLRVAPELFLKQLVIGGFDRVFEIGKQFRNEGLDRTHNPEFTSCEFYEAWADYHDLMETTEELVGGLVTTLGLEPHHRGAALRLAAPFHRAEFLPSLEAALGCSLAPAPDLDSETSLLQLEGLCRREGLDPAGSAARLLDRLAGKLVEPELVQPTLLLHHPAIMSPLSKQHRDQPGIAERFELFIGGQEVCNAYTELNDPALQREALARQADAADPEAMVPDEAYCTALEYGLPPTAGWGAGLDRLTAILTGCGHLRDTLTFPLVTPRSP